MGLGKFPDVVNGYNWELYNLAEDYSENNDLAAKMPDKLRDMKEQFLLEATEVRRVPTGQQLPYSRSEPTAELYGGKDPFHLLW